MTKPNFTASYPLTQAAVVAFKGQKTIFSYGRDIERFSVTADKIRTALEAGEITTVDNKSIRESINRFVDSAFKLVISEKYTYGGAYKSLPEDLHFLDLPREARLIPGFEKKLAKLDKAYRTHPMLQDIVALTNELKELADVVAYLKSVEYKAHERRAAAKVAKAEEVRCNNLTDKVYLAVLPLKEQAIEKADSETRAQAANCLSKLEAAEWNLDAVAPAGDYKADNEIKYKVKNGLRAFYHQFVSVVHSEDYSVRYDRNAPTIVKKDDENIEKVVDRARKDAALQFEIYVAKLNEKINDEVLSATLAGTSVWSESHLTVVTRNKGTQVWHTQIIVNFSKYNKAFNQFPTRLLK